MLDHLGRQAWLCSLPEASRALGISRRSVERLIGRGALGSVKLGRRRLVPIEEIRRLATPAAAPRRSP